MVVHLRDMMDFVLLKEVPAHLFTVAGFILGLFLIARLMSERKAPANTFAWLLIIILVPFIGVPLYLVIGVENCAA